MNDRLPSAIDYARRWITLDLRQLGRTVREGVHVHVRRVADDVQPGGVGRDEEHLRRATGRVREHRFRRHGRLHGKRRVPSARK